jgi:hypothetical protein
VILGPEWRGIISLQVMKEDQVIDRKSLNFVISSYGKKTLSISYDAPKKSGLYTVVALFWEKDETPAKSNCEIIFK